MKQAWCMAAVLVACLTQVICEASEGPAPVSSVKLLKPSAKLLKSDGTSSSYSGSFPDRFVDEPSISSGETLEVSITIKKDDAAFKPQQAFLRLTSKKHGASAFFVAKTKKDAHVATVSLTSLEKQLGKVGGEFELSWLIGDPQLATGIQYDIGVVDVDQPKESPKLPLTASTQPHEFLKPEIIHQHRAPEKRAPASISLLFTGLSFVPLLGLLIPVASLGVNIKGFPTGTAGLAALAFHGGIAGMLGLYLVFWLRLNIVQTLPLAILGGLLVAVSGYKALSAVADNRLKKD